jgi:hypothetical protein
VGFDKTVEIAKLGVQTNYWPLFEVENDVWKLTENKKKLPIEDFLKPQGRFKHMFKPGNEHLIAEFQMNVDRKYAYLQARVEGSKALVANLEAAGLPLTSDDVLAMHSKSAEQFQQ